MKKNELAIAEQSLVRARSLADERQKHTEVGHGFFGPVADSSLMEALTTLVFLFARPSDSFFAGWMLQKFRNSFQYGSYIVRVVMIAQSSNYFFCELFV